MSRKNSSEQDIPTEDSDVQAYQPEEEPREEDDYLPIRRVMSHYTGYDDPEEAVTKQESKTGSVLHGHGITMNHVVDIGMKCAGICFLMGAFSILIFSIYWGSLDKKESHMGKVKMLAVLEDEGVISDEVLSSLNHSAPDWHIFKHSEYMSLHGLSVEQMTAKVEEQVHKQKYWVSLFIAPNTSSELVASLAGKTETFNMTNHVTVTFESGRDNTNVKPIILPPAQAVEAELDNRMLTSIIPSLAPSDVATSQLMIQTKFNYVDYRPFPATVLMAPLQIGVIFIILLTFLHFNFVAPIHAQLVPVVSSAHYIRYRFIVTFISYFLISLFFSFVTLCFQVDFTRAFGRGGFVVYWMTTFLTMLAVGGANTIVISLLLVVYPPLIGFWLLFWVITNVSPAFTPMALTNNFYRYGYAWPGHAALEIYKVILLDLYKGHLGYSYGVLVAWAVVNAVLFPFSIKFVNARLKKRQQGK